MLGKGSPGPGWGEQLGRGYPGHPAAWGLAPQNLLLLLLCRTDHAWLYGEVLWLYGEGGFRVRHVSA